MEDPLVAGGLLVPLLGLLRALEVVRHPSLQPEDVCVWCVYRHNVTLVKRPRVSAGGQALPNQILHLDLERVVNLLPSSCWPLELPAATPFAPA